MASFPPAPHADLNDRLRLELEAGLSDRYRIERELGQGGMAVVFLAHDLHHHRKIALKVLHPELSRTVGAERFEREIQLTAQLQHPNILPVHDSGETAGHLWYTMPYVEGESLGQRLSREHQLSVQEAVRITVEAAHALDYAHRNGIIHRDIKPENLLISRDGNVLVADFGIARSLAGDRLTLTGLAVGTPVYMSPEQSSGQVDLDPRTDQYSLGCVLYEMLAGEPPFRATTSQAIAAKHMHAPVPDLRIVRSTVTAELQKVIETALAKTPADRHSSVADFAAALTASASRPGSSDSSRSRRTRIVSGGIGAISLLLLFAWLFRAQTAKSAHSIATLALAPRIAVLYFGVRTPDSTSRQIAEGLTENLIRELSGVNAFRVVSRNGVAAYRERQVTFDSLVKALAATVVVDGTVQRYQDRVTVQVDLIDAQTDTYLESLSVERALGDFISLEQELVRQVAEALRRQLGREVRLRGNLTGTTSETARALVLKAERARDDAEAMARQQHPEDVRTAIAAWGRADSLLGLAEAADSAWLRPLIERGWVAREHALLLVGSARVPMLERGLAFAEAAVQRAPANAEALELRGTLRWQLVTEFEGAAPDSARLRQAEADLRAAVDRDSTLASAWATLSFLLDGNGAFAEGAIAARRALQEDAYLANADQVYRELFFSALMRAEFQEAETWCQRGRADFPGNWRFVECELTLMRHDAAAPPNPDSAWALVNELERLDPAAKAKASGRVYHTIYRRIVAATISARAGNRTLARAELARARQATADDSFLQLDLAYDEAYLRLVLGERREAVALLNHLMEARPVLRPLLARDPLFAALFATGLRE
ncbi:MAG TPA: serine/threonine-protein kinase [Gemmatimonadales bacterium]|nr:serine/threonine-protein kinase [Gemmatimonadales bacterium]